MLIGEHNFVYFSKTGSKPKSTIRSVYFAKIYKYQDNFVIYIKANSFLRGQIRMIMSFLLKISDKKLTIEDFEEQLNAKQRISWTLAPASGLYLTNTSY
jgi:tRNA pseudouridine38-40 synthase